MTSNAASSCPAGNNGAGSDAPGKNAPADHLPETAGDVLRALRHVSGLSQRAMAESLGVAASTVARIETQDQRADSWALIDRAARSLGLRLVVIDASGEALRSPPFPEARSRGGRRFPAHAVIRRATAGDLARDEWRCWFTKPYIEWSFDHPNFRSGWELRRSRDQRDR